MSALSKFTPRYRAQTSQKILSHWDGFVQDWVSAYEADWVQAIRNRSKEKLLEQGLPTQKLERFKYFNLPSWIKKNEIAYQKADIKGDGHTLMFARFVRTFKRATTMASKNNGVISSI